MLANTKQEIQADPRAMRKKYLTSKLYSFYQDADPSSSFLEDNLALLTLGS